MTLTQAVRTHLHDPFSFFPTILDIFSPGEVRSLDRPGTSILLRLPRPVALMVSQGFRSFSSGRPFVIVVLPTLDACPKLGAEKLVTLAPGVSCRLTANNASCAMCLNFSLETV